MLQKLGYFSGDAYLPVKFVEKLFIKRRQNFFGLQVSAMTHDYPAFIEIKDIEKAPFYASNQTYDVTNHMFGSTYDIWMLLQENLNFTTRIFRRKNLDWGVPILYPNGSIVVPKGIIRDMATGQADFAITPLVILYSRHLVMDYLHPMFDTISGIYIAKGSLHEKLDFTVFKQPFSTWTWIILLILSILTGFCIVFMSELFNLKRSSNDITRILATTLQANLGVGSFSFLTNQRQPLYILTFTILLMGHITWQAYNGSLLSVLMAPKFVKPFHDLETLSKSNYR